MRKGIKSRDEELVVENHPKSVVAEAYRALRTNISFLSPDEPLKTIMVTSGGPVEGKSLTVANLGISFAQAGKKVIIIDADLRKPMQHRFFKLTNFDGLTSILTGEKEFSSVIRESGINNLKILTSGVTPPNPSELLGSKKMDSILEQAKEEADSVLVDVPPVIAVTDGLVLASKVDGVVLVVASQETHREMVAQAKENLEKVKANIVGTVLTKVPIESGGKYYYYYYGPDK